MQFWLRDGAPTHGRYSAYRLPVFARRPLLDLHMWLSPFAVLLAEQGRGADCLTVARAGIQSPWPEAMEALAADRFTGAADIYRTTGSRFVWAWASLLAAEHGQLPPSALAEVTAHFQHIGATPYLRRIDALPLASA